MDRKKVVTPVEYEKDGKKKTFWMPIGTAWVSSEKISIKIDASPLSGKLMIFLEDREKPEQGNPELPF